MVGLSVLLENQKNNHKTQKLINKSTIINKPSSPFLQCQPPSSSSSSSSSFLAVCFLCGQRLLPGKDIYMYKGDRAFCSVDCRCKQMSKDEEETSEIENPSFSFSTSFYRTTY